jgi:hypothetical protein
MGSKLLLVAAALAAFLTLLGLLLGRARRRDARMIVQRPTLEASAAPRDWNSSLAGANAGVSVEHGRELYRLLSGGERVQAVALVRERTGMGKAESEAAVERMERLMNRLEG